MHVTATATPTSRASRQDLNIDTRTATEYGVVRTFTDVVFTWTSGTFGAALLTAGTAYTGDGIGGGTLGVYHAFIQFAGFTMGRTISIFDTPWTNYPGNNFDGLVGGSGDVTGVNQLTYTAAFGNGVSLAVSAQEAMAYYRPTSGTRRTAVREPAPFRATAATFASSYGPTFATGVYGTPSIAARGCPISSVSSVSTRLGVCSRLRSRRMHNHPTYYTATNEATGHPDAKFGWAGQLALSIKNIPTGVGDSINIQGAYAEGASRYELPELGPDQLRDVRRQRQRRISEPRPCWRLGRGFRERLRQLELTTSYGIRGAFNHNWDPYWTSSIYGA